VNPSAPARGTGATLELRSPRLRLRPYRAEDLDLIAALYADPRVTAYTKLGLRDRAESRAVLEGYIAEWSERGVGMFALFLEPAGDFVGEFGVFRLDAEGDMALRYALFESYWGQGLIAEAGGAVLDDAFGRAGLPRLLSIVQRRNPASGRVVEKLGFSVERTAWDGEIELLVYALDRRTWCDRQT
jgi:RimJ/RimL family protein N-acetyltransferase